MLKFFKFPFRFALFIPLLAASPRAQDALRLDFLRYTWENGRVDSVQGRLWQYPPRHIALMISHPVEQWMFLDSNKMTLYYPREKKAFRFTAKREFAMPFFQAFVSAKEGKAVLPEMGFTLRQNLEKGDTLFTFWDPPVKSRKVVGVAKVGLVQGLLAVSEVDDPKGNPLVKSFFRKYRNKDHVSFPMEIEIQSQAKNHSMVEKDLFENMQLHASLPPEIRDFQIPADAQTKDVEW